MTSEIDKLKHFHVENGGFIGNLGLVKTMEEMY